MPEKNASKLEIYAAMQAAREFGCLPIFTVYDRPRDYPDGFIARMFLTGKIEIPTLITVLGSLEEIRETMIEVGMTRIERYEKDDPKILECWL